MSTETRDVNLTDGALFRPLVVLSLPIVASQLMQVAYNLADTFWVGRLGQDAVSALSFSFPLVFVLVGAGGGFTAAGSVLVAQHRGAGNDSAVDHVAGQTVGFVLLVSLAVAAIGYLFAPTVLSLIGTTPGTDIHSMGDTRTPMYLMAVGVGFNVLLDPFLVLGFRNNVLFPVLGLADLQSQLYAATGFAGMGVQGAAVATVISRGFTAVVGIAILFSGRVGIDISPSDLVPERETIRQIVEVGAPLGVEQSMTPLTMTVMTAIVAVAGPAAVAAFGVANRIIAVIFLPAQGLGQGTETLVGQNLGASKPDRAKRGVVLSSLVVGVVMVASTVVSLLYAGEIVSLFVSGPGADAVVAHGRDYLTIFGLTFVFMGVFRIVIATFRGSGSAREAMAFALVGLWVFRVPLAYAGLVFGDGATGIWWGMAAGNTLGTLAATAWLLRGTWTDSVVETDEGAPAPTD
jgi:putative MATE family efflux protein